MWPTYVRDRFPGHNKCQNSHLSRKQCNIYCRRSQITRQGVACVYRMSLRRCMYCDHTGTALNAHSLYVHKGALCLVDTSPLKNIQGKAESTWNTHTLTHTHTYARGPLYFSLLILYVGLMMTVWLLNLFIDYVYDVYPGACPINILKLVVPCVWLCL